MSLVRFTIFVNSNPVMGNSTTAQLTAKSSTKAHLFVLVIAHNTSIMIKRGLEFMREKVETIQMGNDSDSMIM